MDIEGYIEQHQPQWDRLRELAGARRLSGAEADELVDLYQRTATHLSVVRGSAYDPELEARLSSLLTHARAAITGSGGSMVNGVGLFLARTVPAALYRLRWWVLGVAAAWLGLATLVCLRVLADPGLLHQYWTVDEQQKIADVWFAAYYSANPPADFMLQVWLNNVLVSATCMLLGITVLPAVFVLWTNASHVGLLAGLLIHRDRGDVFFGMLLPHGMLELTCVFVAGAAGLRMAWSWIAPGPLPRSRALGREGRALGAVIVGLVLGLCGAGLLEAYVTPSGLPPSWRLAIGLAAWLLFGAYVLVLGRRAVLAGLDGDVTGAGAMALAPIESAV